jgi:hypothetical protein
MTAKKIHVLVAKDAYHGMEGSGQILHRRAFIERSAADDAIPAFTEACCDPDAFSSLDRRVVRVSVVELELVE